LSKRGFEELLLEAVDEALSSLGGSLRQETYLQLEESFNVKKQEIPYKTEAFAKAIEQIFGSDVVDVEILILNRLYEKVGATFKPEKSTEFSFTEHLSQARGRLYEAFVNSMKSGFAVFHFENIKDLSSFRLIAANSVAAKLAGEAAERLVGKTIAETYPEILKAHVPKILEEVILSAKTKNLGNFYFGAEGDSRNHCSATIFPLSNNCIGIAFKNFIEPKQTDKSLLKSEAQFQEVAASMGEWRWEPDAQWRQIYASRLRARELWIRKKITRQPGRAEYLSIRGRECLETGALVRARELFHEAEEIYREFNKMEEAFENASLRVNAYFLEEKVILEEYLGAAEEYFQKYRDFSTHEYFLENLAHYCQWKAYKHSEENESDNARASYSKAENLFLSLKKREEALFNASRRVFTYKQESNIEEYLKSAEEFFEKYKELSGNRYYKEIRAHYFSYKANQSGDFLKSIEFLNAAENLFLEINQRELAFENACKKIDVYWIDISYYEERSVKTCLEATEKFFEAYQDFSEHHECRKRLSKYYLFQIRSLISQLKTSWH
jgi:PAS domain-containing protein